MLQGLLTRCVPIFLHSSQNKQAFQSHANMYHADFDNIFSFFVDELQILRALQGPGTKLWKLPKSLGKSQVD